MYPDTLRAELNRTLMHAAELQVDALALMIEAGEQALALYQQSTEELATLSNQTGEAGVTQAALRGRAYLEILRGQVQGQKHAREITKQAIEKEKEKRKGETSR